MAPPTEVVLSNGAGSKLTFRLEGRGPHETKFVVLLETPWLRCSAPASTYVSGPPVALFRDIAENWRGWEGEKSWSDLEGRVKFGATCDSTGHVTINVMIVGPNYRDRAEVDVIFDAGTLEAMSDSLALLFALGPT
jgi:hypothetical protein